ncbi:PREDICTED: uncharacterized protein LOC108767435 [Trachymyrmex cornetzi]|uniref:uncharacterized protein LOC108767435 n=1 Tax=Trachymyrmex cornetzi TaxID=471704 RepID=UPI00084F759D|nr:PREDICTED: uncharacterized protein LOC108767435 [Trachymyrmex cornetzi]
MMRLLTYFWPPKNWPKRGSRLVHSKRAVQNCIEPEIQWPRHKGTVLHLYREHDDAIKGLKKAEDDTSLETEVNGAPRKRKLPKRYLDFDKDGENEENDMSLKKKGLRSCKIRRLSESTTDSTTTLPQMNSDILNEVKNINVFQVVNKEIEKTSRKQPVENYARIKVLREFRNNSSRSCEQKQLKKVCNSQCERNVNKKHEKQRKINGNIKQNNLVSNKTMQKKRNALITISSSTLTPFSLLSRTK